MNFPRFFFLHFFEFPAPFQLFQSFDEVKVKWITVTLLITINNQTCRSSITLLWLMGNKYIKWRIQTPEHLIKLKFMLETDFTCQLMLITWTWPGKLIKVNIVYYILSNSSRNANNFFPIVTPTSPSESTNQCENISMVKMTFYLELLVLTLWVKQFRLSRYKGEEKHPGWNY